MTGADLFNILNIAAVRSSAEDLPSVPMSHLEEAYDRVVVGLERRNPMSDYEKNLTAYHEGGHTLVSMGTAGSDPVHKATIMPRGQALGITWSIPEQEKYSETVCELKARLDVLMGGKAAEELIFGPEKVTAGCSSDLQQATRLAKRMVMNFGMGQDAPAAPIYMDLDDYSQLSESARRDIDSKVQALLTDAYARSFSYLKGHERELRYLAEAMVEFETLNAEEIVLATKGKSKVIAQRRKVAADCDSKERQEMLEKRKVDADRRSKEKSVPPAPSKGRPRPAEIDADTEDE